MPDGLTLLTTISELRELGHRDVVKRAQKRSFRWLSQQVADAVRDGRVV